jgi:hypothetical protein
VLKSAFCGGKVQVVWRDDRNEIHAFAERESGLGFHHFFEGSVATRGWQEKISAGIARALWVAAEGTADEFDLSVHIGCDAMNAADEGAASTTDHAHADLAL